MPEDVYVYAPRDGSEKEPSRVLAESEGKESLIAGLGERTRSFCDVAFVSVALGSSD